MVSLLSSEFEKLDFQVVKEKVRGKSLEKVGQGGSLIFCLVDQLLLTQMQVDHAVQEKEEQGNEKRQIKECQ